MRTRSASDDVDMMFLVGGEGGQSAADTQVAKGDTLTDMSYEQLRYF